MAKKQTYEELEQRVKDLEKGATELIRAEEETRRQGAFFDNIIDLNPYSVQICDKEGHHVRGNQAFIELFKEAPPPEYSIFDDPNLKKAGVQELVRKVKGGETVSLPDMLYNPHDIKSEYPDKLVCIRTVIFALSAPNGEIENVVLMHEDITKQRRAEEALRVSEEMYRLLVETMSDGLGIQDKDGLITYVNDTFCKMLNYKSDEFVGRPVTDFLDERNKQILKDQMDKRRQSEVKSYELKWTRKDGNKLPTIMSPQATFNEKGDFQGSFAVITDISYLKQAEDALRERTKELNERVKELNCLYNISNLLEKPNISLDEVIQGVVGFIPSSWQYPDITCSRIILEDEEHKTVNFKETGWKQSSDILVHGKRMGVLEICYLEERPEIDEGPFLKEERDLISAITERLGHIIGRMRTDKALQESEEKYRLLVDNASEGILVAQNGVFVFTNQKGEELFGYSQEELASKPLTDFVHEEDREMVRDRHERRLKGEIFTAAYPFRIVCKSGDIKWMELNVALFSWNRKPATLCFMTDISEKKQTEEVLRESEEKYRTIFDNIQDVYFESSLDGVILEISPSIESISKYKREELIGKSLYDFYTNPDERNELVKVVLTKGRVSDVEINLTDKDGSQSPCSFNILLIVDEQKNPLKFVGSMRDISERKQAEQVKRKLEAQLQQAQKLESVGILAGGIAHDFNNLMSVVVGNISLAKTEMKTGSKAFKNLVKAEKASIQTKELTARLIIFSEGGGPVKETASIGDLVKSSVGSSLKGSDLNCRFSIPDDISPVEVDEEQMKQVIHNIITNAKEAVAGQGTINVFCENADIGEKDTLTLKDGKYVKISIEDQGPGIPEEDLAKIFDPYFSTKEMGTQKGMGLGLAISDSIVKKHDGLITVESELGTGTTFSIYLPASEKEIVEAAPVKKTVPEKYVTRGGKILVMDDEEMVRDVSNALLTHLGYEAEVAVEGIEAIEMYRKAIESEKPFDMVILDLTNKVGMGGG